MLAGWHCRAIAEPRNSGSTTAMAGSAMKPASCCRQTSSSERPTRNTASWPAVTASRWTALTFRSAGACASCPTTPAPRPDNSSGCSCSVRTVIRLAVQLSTQLLIQSCHWRDAAAGSPLCLAAVGSDGRDRQVEGAVWSVVVLRLEVDHQLTAPIFGNGLQQAVEFVQGLAGEIHLGDQLVVAAPSDLEVDMWRPAPGLANLVRAGLDGPEAVAAVGIAYQFRPALEVRVQRRGIRIGLMRIAAVDVGLPDVDHHGFDRLSGFVQHATFDHDDFTLGRSGSAVDPAQVGILVGLVGDREEGTFGLRRCNGGDQRPGRDGGGHACCAGQNTPARCVDSILVLFHARLLRNARVPESVPPDNVAVCAGGLLQASAGLPLQ